MGSRGRGRGRDRVLTRVAAKAPAIEPAASAATTRTVRRPDARGIHEWRRAAARVGDERRTGAEGRPRAERRRAGGSARRTRPASAQATKGIREREGRARNSTIPRPSSGIPRKKTEKFEKTVLSVKAITRPRPNLPPAACRNAPQRSSGSGRRLPKKFWCE